MPAPFVIAQTTDLHIKPPGELAYRTVDTAAALTHLIVQLKSLRPRPAMVVATGDLVDGASEAAYAVCWACSAAWR